MNKKSLDLFKIVKRIGSVFLICLIPFLLWACSVGRNTPNYETIQKTQPGKDVFASTTSTQPKTTTPSPVSATRTIGLTQAPTLENQNHPVPTGTPTKKPFDSNSLIQALDEKALWYVLIKEVGSDEAMLEINADKEFFPASMIKVPISMAVLAKNQELGRSLQDLRSIGTNGRNFSALLYASVVKSEENATDILENFAWGDNFLRNQMDAWGLTNTFFDPRRSTCHDLSLALEGLYQGSLIGEDASEYLLQLMREKTENDALYLGVMLDYLPNARFANKRGTMVGPTVVADHGILEYNGKAWVIVVAGTPDVNDMVSFETIEESIERFAEIFAEEIKALSETQP